MIYNDWLYYQYMAVDGYVNLSNLCGITMGKLNAVEPPDWYKVPPNFDDLHVIKCIQDGSSVAVFQGEEEESLDYLRKIMSRISNRSHWESNSFNGSPTYVNIMKAIELKVVHGIEVHACYNNVGIPFKRVESTEKGHEYIRSLIMMTGYLK